MIKKRFIMLMLSLLILVPIFTLETSAAFSGDDRIVIAIDPGHGGIDPGAQAPGVIEKEFNFKLANLLKKYLDENGSFVTYLTRSGDYVLQNCERAMVANDVNADILISIHFDSCSVPSINGTTAYTSVFDEYALMSLSYSMTSSISEATGLASNGVKRKTDDEYFWNYEKQWDIKDPSLSVPADYYGVIAWSSRFGMRSVIVEHGFMSNPHDRDIITSSGTIEKMARADADAIISYYTNHTHTYSSRKRDFPSNCVFQGKSSEHCTICDHRKNVTFLPEDKDNHYWVTTSYTPAKCGEDGIIESECRITKNLIEKKHPVPNHTKTEIIPAPTQHDYTITAEVLPTHTVDGYRQYKCSLCSSSYTETLAAEGHSWEYISYTSPTCIQSGGYLYHCDKCGENRLDVEAALGHKYIIIEEVLPECKKAGHRTSKCDVCDYILEEDLEQTGHDISLCTITESTCTENGSIIGKCAVCGDDIDETIEATGHSFETTSERKATCTEDGLYEKTCSVCGEKETEIRKSEGHAWVTLSTKEPTCEYEGITELSCSVCGATEIKKVDKTDHSWQLEKEVAPGIFKNGNRLITCTVCGSEMTEELRMSTLKRSLYIAIPILSVLILTAAFFIVLTIIKKKKAAAKLSETEKTGNNPEEIDNEKSFDEDFNQSKDSIQDAEKEPVGNIK